MPRWILLSLLGLMAARATAAPEPQRVEVTRDAWISSFPREREGNNGAAPRLKLKGIQEFFLIDFDPAPWRGRRIVRAQLHLHAASPEKLGRVTVSSVASPWVEGRGTNYAVLPGASSFRWAQTGERRWGGDGTDLTAVVLGQGGSVWGFGDASPRDADGWQVIPISPAVVQARLDGRSEGFLVMDDVGSEYTRNGPTIEYRAFPNRFFSSREGPRDTAPYFTLWLADDPAQPEPVSPPLPPHADTGHLPPEPAAAAQPEPPAVACLDSFGEPLASLEFCSARNETIGFIVTAASADVVLADVATRTFAMPRVGTAVDPLVPLALRAKVAEAAADSDQVYIELHVPKSAARGRHEGELRVGGRRLPLAVTVWDFTLPDRLSFVPQMNAYSLPGDERAYYRLAHEHRTVLNRLAYGWTGRVDRGCAPVIGADGRWDWTAWDARFGPLLDGTAFADLPRAGVPVDAFYLPLNENWPMDHERHFRGGYWIESAYPDEYWREFRAAAEAFADHFAARGWTEPVFEFYLNNKVYFKRDRGNRWDASSAAWIFDEPVNTQDFWALRRFGLEFWRGVERHPDVRFSFRADLSRPEWQRDLLDGVTSTEIVSGALRTYHERVMARAARFGHHVAMYGSSPPPGTSHVMPVAWCVETWALGADGVVPWQTIGKSASWTEPDPLSLFYPTAVGPMPSLRLKSFRAGQQLVEYLTLFTAESGQSRAAVGAAVLAETGLQPRWEKSSEADAGTMHYDAHSAHALERLRLRLGTWLDERAPAPRAVWHDPRPRRHDASAVPEIRPLPAP